MADENQTEIHDCAVAVVELIGVHFGDLHYTDGLMALFGAALMIAREGGLPDHDLHQGFGVFLEDNPE